MRKHKLTYSTRRFLRYGAEPEDWDKHLYFAVKDMARLGYDLDEIEEELYDRVGELGDINQEILTKAFKAGDQFNE